MALGKSCYRCTPGFHLQADCPKWLPNLSCFSGACGSLCLHPPPLSVSEQPVIEEVGLVQVAEQMLALVAVKPC